MATRVSLPGCAGFRFFHHASHIRLTLRPNSLCARAGGALSTEEVLAYLLKHCGCDAEKSLKFMRVLDTNGDGLVSAAEWHEAWQNGEFSLEVVNAPSDSTTNVTSRRLWLTSKHLSRSNLLAPLSPKTKWKPAAAKGTILRKKSSKYTVNGKKVLPEVKGGAGEGNEDGADSS